MVSVRNVLAVILSIRSNTAGAGKMDRIRDFFLKDTRRDADADRSVLGWGATRWPRYAYPALHGDGGRCTPGDGHPARPAAWSPLLRACPAPVVANRGSALPCPASAGDGCRTTARVRLTDHPQRQMGAAGERLPVPPRCNVIHQRRLRYPAAQEGPLQLLRHQTPVQLARGLERNLTRL
jgi:hypothetical protein